MAYMKPPETTGYFLVDDENLKGDLGTIQAPDLGAIPNILKMGLILLLSIVIASLTTFLMEKKIVRELAQPTLVVQQYMQIDTLQTFIDSILKRLEVQKGINGRNTKKFNDLEQLELDILLVNERIDLIIGGEKE